MSAVEVHRGGLDATGMRLGIVVGRFNAVVTRRLLDGAVEALVGHGARESDIVVAWVPGSFEIPLAARQLVERREVDGVVCLGAVIRGDTPHFDLVAGGAASGISSVSGATGRPATLGLITAENLEQAMDRAGGRHGNKGAEAALAAVEMVSLLRSLGRPPPP